jgi:hypothetical protein
LRDKCRGQILAEFHECPQLLLSGQTGGYACSNSLCRINDTPASESNYQVGVAITGGGRRVNYNIQRDMLECSDKGRGVSLPKNPGYLLK